MQLCLGRPRNVRKDASHTRIVWTGLHKHDGCYSPTYSSYNVGRFSQVMWLTRYLKSQWLLSQVFQLQHPSWHWTLVAFLLGGGGKRESEILCYLICVIWHLWEPGQTSILHSWVYPCLIVGWRNGDKLFDSNLFCVLVIGHWAVNTKRPRTSE